MKTFITLITSALLIVASLGWKKSTPKANGIYQFKVKTIDGKEITLEKFKGKKMVRMPAKKVNICTDKKIFEGREVEEKVPRLRWVMRTRGIN